ncbi:MAG: 50S ribosomal protein L29 [Myxococcota bacterium]
MPNAKEIRAKSDEDLATEEKALRKAIFDTRYKHATRQLEDTASLRRQRRDLARMLTVKSERAAQTAQKTEKK